MITDPAAERVGLPHGIEACLFDMDGVLTDTARLHRLAWAATFDEFLCRRAGTEGSAFEPFDSNRDYDRYIDGKLRYDGVRAFLAARRIQLPDGDPSDPPTVDTICGLGNRKNERVLTLLRDHGVAAFVGSTRYLRAARAAGLRCGVVSASANADEVLRNARLAQWLEVQVDGNVARTKSLRGKPAPDTYLEGARLLHVEPERAAVFEDAAAGVDAARAGGFGFVVGVARSGDDRRLRRHGADVVVTDLADLLESPQ